ncbi:MAG: ornithine carbamoyltransferase [bacterium]|nr:ornithine carbamoyltransferase [bacterium]
MQTRWSDGVVAKIGAGNFTQDLDASQDELQDVLALTHEVKRSPERFRTALAGQYLSLLFEKPSLRTRLTFELAIKQLGGDSVTAIGPIGGREPVKDVARNLERWTQCIVARTYAQQTIDDLAKWASVPVVNALSDLYHPCQALADVFTIQEQFGELRGLKLAFVGDGNNVAHSLMLDAPRLGMDIAIATPKGYEPNIEVIAEAEGLAAVSGSTVTVTDNPVEAVQGAHTVYTDVWASMGLEKEADRRRIDFQPYQVTLDLLDQALPEAVFMHCLPAKRGEETVDEVLESPKSVVFDQAENRMHTQKALLLMLLG